MSGRTAKLVSALLVSVLAEIPLASVAYAATPAADDCLSGPKDQAPRGSHWHYRIDRETKRHCWYLKDETLAPSAAANSSPAKPVSPNSDATTSRSIADAHAELLAPTAIEQPKRGNNVAPAPTMDAAVAAPAAEPQRSVIASRWLEPSANSSSAAGNPDVVPPPGSETVAAANPAPEKQAGSLQTLLLVIVGALALAGLIGGAVVRFGNARWIGGRRTPVDRRSIWEQTDLDRRSPPWEPDPGVGIRRDDIPWELRTEDDPHGRLQDMLARLARSAAN